MSSKKTTPLNLSGILNMAIYQKIRNLLKLKLLRPYHATKTETEKKSDVPSNSNSNSPSNLEQLLEHAITEKERISLIYKDKLFVAAVPVEDIELVKQVETCLNAKTPQTRKAIEEIQ